MPVCLRCGASYAGKRCSHCASKVRLRSRAGDRRFNKPIILLLAGTLALLITMRRYPLLDRNPYYWAALALFFIPTVSMIVSNLLKRLKKDAGALAKLFFWCAVANVTLFATVFLNGLLDRGPAVRVQARVIGKRISRGRSTTYRMAVESWRLGRTEEVLELSRAQFQAIHPDSIVGIELHRGWFGLPWYGRIFTN